MKVVNVFEDARVAGPQIYILNLLTSIPKSKIDMTILMPEEFSGDFQSLCSKANVKFKVVPLSRIGQKIRVLIKYILSFPFDIIRLYKVFKAEDYDLIYLCGGSWQFRGLIAGKLLGKKVIWHLNDAFIPLPIRINFFFLSKFADGFVFASKRSKQYYERYIRSDIRGFIIPSSVDVLKFNPDLVHVDLSMKEEFKNKIVIGTVANINPIKGLENLIYAAATLNKKFDNIFFLIVGPIFPTQEIYYQNLINLMRINNVNNIRFIGATSDVRPYLKLFDIYACCSKSESSPIAVWEAMSMSKPIVSTDVGDVACYIDDQVSGFITKVNDHEELALRLNDLILNKGMRIQFSKVSRRIAKNKLSVELCSLRHQEAFNFFLANT